MNRLILVGNGFDLAHDLKTSYKDFIDDFWENKLNIIPRNINSTLNEIDVFYLENSKPVNIDNTVKTYNDLKKSIINQKANIIFYNEFLKIISEKNASNWVDIEY